MLIGYNKFYATLYPKKDYYRWSSSCHVQCYYVRASLSAFDAPFARVNATETLKQRFSREYTQSLDVKYSKGSPQLSRESPSGTVLGYVTDTKTRQKLLQAQPFADCSGGCSSWQPYSEYGKTSPLLSIEQNSSPDSRNILRAATGEGSQCVARYRPESHGDIFCLSPSTGAFAYRYDGAS